MVQKLIAGLHRFRSGVFRQEEAFFQRLASGQTPQTLFITCSDSRIDPNLITHTDPGELFVLRNAGNLVPPYGAANGGETATIEFAVAGLGVSDIVVCGHSHCGAMKGLLKPEILQEMPAVAEWLKHAETTRRIVRTKYAHLTGDDLLDATIDEHVLVQIENLQTHPAVAVGLADDKLKLHAWVYDIPTGEVYSYREDQQQFASLTSLLPPGTPPPSRILDSRSGDARFDVT